ncbi:MAG: hypothetical protein ACT4PT_07760 [Methanobacteriota archaeon]
MRKGVLALLSLGTGIVVSLGTRWGLFRHYWVVLSLVLTTLAVAVLLVETRVIASHASVALDPESSAADLAALGNTVPHSIGGLVVVVVLGVVLALNVYKPAGVTPYGWRKERERTREERT